MKIDLYSEFDRLRGELNYSQKDSNIAGASNWVKELEIELTQEEIPTFIKTVAEVFSVGSGLQQAPSFLISAIENLLHDDYVDVKNICDPFARVGSIILPVWELTKPKNALAITCTEKEAYLGKLSSKNKNIEWRVGNSLKFILDIDTELDVVCSIPPFGVKRDKTIELPLSTGENIELRDDLGDLIIASFCQKLTSKGVGIFVVPSSFFWSNRSVYQHFDRLDIGVNAALALPPGAFAPHTNIETYLIVIKKQVSKNMFVAQLSHDLITNNQIISNYKQGIVGESLELGRVVESSSFKSLNTIRIKERIEKAKSEFMGKPWLLEDVANSINSGRHGDDFISEEQPNTVYIPLGGNSHVVEAIEDISLKNQNYAQVIIDPKKSNSRFIVHFLNSELGIEIRELSKIGTTALLNKKALRRLQLLLPDMDTQKKLLEVQDLIIAEKNILLGLQNELLAIERELWSNPHDNQGVKKKIQAVSLKNTKAGKSAEEQTDAWIDTLPFPLASILRSWYATSNNDYKSKYEYLLHFFEATAQFVSVILLSAFKTNDSLYRIHESQLLETFKKSNINFKRSTFGTWKFIADYFSKQVRTYIHSNGKDYRAIGADIFADPTLKLPYMLCDKGLMLILETTNKMRNDWTGHSGVVGQDTAKKRNEMLLLELHKLRNIFADTWEEIYLIKAENVWPRKSAYDNEIAILMGSNSNFYKDIWAMTTELCVDSLYLHKKGHSKSLELLPFIQMSASPESSKNACYFFNRYQEEGIRFISYHYMEEAEIILPFETFSEIESLFETK